MYKGRARDKTHSSSLPISPVLTLNYLGGAGCAFLATKFRIFTCPEKSVTSLSPSLYSLSFSVSLELFLCHLLKNWVWFERKNWVDLKERIELIWKRGRNCFISNVGCRILFQSNYTVAWSYLLVQDTYTLTHGRARSHTHTHARAHGVQCSASHQYSVAFRYC